MSDNKKIFWSNVGYSFATVGWVIILSWICLKISECWLNNIIWTYNFNCIFLAPLIEEYSKRICFKKGFPYLYTYIFGFSEFFLYIFSYMIQSHDITLYFAFRRLVCVGMHYIYTLAQVQSSKEGYDGAGYFLAVIIHSMQNFLALAGAGLI